MRWTASKASLLARCQYPFRDDVEVPENDTAPRSEDQLVGMALHRLAELWTNEVDPDQDVIAEVVESFDIAASLPRILRVWTHMRAWLEENLSTVLAVAEQKIAIDFTNRKAWIIGRPGVRDYGPLPDGVYGMTVDLHLMRDGVEVLDWKTGHSIDGYWPQIGVNALALSWLHGVSEVRGGMLHATESGVGVRSRLFDRLDLAAIADDVMRDLALIPTAEPKPGSHCYDPQCPLLATCSGPRQVVANTVDALLPPDKRLGPNALDIHFVDADQVANALDALRTYGALEKHVKKAAELFVGDEKHALRRGGTLQKSYRTMPRTSVPELIALARAKGASDDEIKACTHDVRENNGIRVVGGSR